MLQLVTERTVDIARKTARPGRFASFGEDLFFQGEGDFPVRMSLSYRGYRGAPWKLLEGVMIFGGALEASAGLGSFGELLEGSGAPLKASVRAWNLLRAAEALREPS